MRVACASSPKPPEGMKVGQFVRFSCEGSGFQARVAEDGKSVRVRALHGSAELDMKSEGIYEGEGYRLATAGSDAVSLMHNGRLQGKNCKAA